jgi:hypothetical protein
MKSISIFILLSIVVLFSLTYLYNEYRRQIQRYSEYLTTNDSPINKTVWLLWFQGWDNAPHLQRVVAESWKTNNPTWTIRYLDMENLKDYITDIEYIYDNKKDISYQAKSDIIRLSLLKNHGGVWADSTMLCMQPLDGWVEKAIEPSSFWMYHGNGGGMDIKNGPASWFIVSKKGSYIITKWKEACDKYWNSNDRTDNYFWMDSLFKELFETDQRFRNEWNNVPYLSCEEDGSSHTLSKHGAFDNNHEYIKKMFKETPPFALKFWNSKNEQLSNCKTDNKCLDSIGYYAIEMSKRKYTYDHFSDK